LLQEILQVEADAKLQKRLAEETNREKQLAEQQRAAEENEMWLKGQAIVSLCFCFFFNFL